MRLTAFVLISLSAAATPGAPLALAQPASPVEDDAVEQRIERLERAAREFAPAKPSVIAEVHVGGPGAEMNAGVAADPMAGARGGDLREGAAVIDVRGRIAYTPAGWVFAADPAPTTTDSKDAPRVVLRMLPSPTSERLREIIAERSAAGEPPATFRVSGRVLVDRGRVYLLPVFATVLEMEEVADPETEPVLSDPVDVDADTSNPDDPSVRELIERIERASDAEREGTREIFAGGGEGSTPGVRLLTGRVARLGRAPDGRLTVAFESGAAQRPGDEIDRAAVLPCRLYGALEQIWASRGDGARLLVSGEAFRDDDRWFLLPSLVEVERAAPSGLRTLR